MNDNATSAPTGEEWVAMKSTTLANQKTVEDEETLRSAKRNIETIRKTDATLLLLNKDGSPLANTEVEIEQTKHSFCFGDQVWPLDALIRDGRGSGERARAWRHRFEEMFNASINLCYWTEAPRNDGSKMEDRQGEPRIENFAETINWTRASGMTAKGHPLFWSIDKCTPEWVKRYDNETFMKFAEVRVRNLVARFRGKVTIWDAVNEAIWEAAPKNLHKRQWPHIEPISDIVDYISPVLKWCREEDPDATYLINDYGTENNVKSPIGSDGSEVTGDSQRARYIALARALCDAGTPPDAIGLQAHTGGWISPSRQNYLFDEYAAKTGLPVHITEYWASMSELRKSGHYSEDELNEIEAQQVEDFLICAFGHPAVDAFFFWGFMSAAINWRDEFSSHTLKPVWYRVKKLLHEEWNTKLVARTDETGHVTFRGFKGDYAVRKWLNSVQKGSTFRVDDSISGKHVIQL